MPILGMLYQFPPNNPRSGAYRSPWGAILTAQTIADGVSRVHTASGGGLMLKINRWMQFQKAATGFVSTDGPGLLEENCDLCFGMLFLADEIGLTDRDRYRFAMGQSLLARQSNAPSS